ncbi:MAG: lipopolysaccharide heptosyltransferase II [Verrucomicrobiota bacterium]|nr:lipopolysaccharide heptosyltransferase II [Verrucomicrobiota bacterium]
MKILILKPSSLGDVVQALPVLRLLRLHYPKAYIAWWIAENLADLLREDPDIDEMFLFKRSRYTQPACWPDIIRDLHAIRSRKFDLVIDLQSLARSGTIAWLANGGMLVGLEDRREGAHGYYDRATPRPSQQTHAVDWYLQVLTDLGIPITGQFEWLPRKQRGVEKIEKILPENQPLILLNPGARWENKRWPTSHFAEVAAFLAGDHPAATIAILGGKEDNSLAEEIQSQAPSVRFLNLAGKTPLVELIEWIRRGDVMISNDTGPMHIAAAVRTPVVALFGPTSELRTGPYGQLGNVLRLSLPCAPCMKPKCHWPERIACLNRITPATVAESASRLLKSPAGKYSSR